MNWFDAVPMTLINDRIWLGNYYNGTQLVEENPNGITAVLDVSANPPYEHGKLKYHREPFWDGHTIPETMFWSSLLWLREMYDSGETILLHCVAGISRSPTIAASFLTYHLDWDFNRALRHLSQVRPIVNPATAVVVSAKSYLKVWPYDGSVGSSEIKENGFVWMDASRAAQAHPNPECLLRKFFILADKLNDRENTPRHTIPCTCTR